DYIKDGGQEMFNTLKAMNLSDQEDVDYNLVEPPQVPLEPRPKSLAQRAEEIMEEDRLKAEKQAHSPSAEKDFDPIKASPEELSAHALDQIRKYSTDPKAMKEYLDFMSHFPGMSPRNAALVQEQWPGAQAVATYNQWQDKGKALGIKPDDVYQSTRTFTNKKTGKTKTVHYDQLSVKTGEKSKITLLRPVMVKMIPVMDATGKPVKTEQGRTKYKPQSEASPAEKAKIKSKELPVKEFMSGKFTTYKVFELSQTTLKPESYPKAMPNRQFDFDMDKVQTDKVLKGLCDYGNKIGVEMSFDKTHKLGNAKGAYFPKAQTILINPNNTPGEQVATSIHELAHATLHNPKFMSKGDVKLDTSHKELEAEMTAYIVSKHFGLDTSEESIPYMASWTDNLNKMSDKELDYSMKRVHKAADQVVKCVENRTNPTPPRTRDRGISPGPKPPVPKPLNP
ncbi:ImmA/IrrE family metallo-endopeptidase, partial [Streptococcus sobrinus]|uniref:ImmA/IrrE family metallo-endopeptidase n=1 Tax=Streptococcus sobrinus TaxID=1310 RepID=UPI000492BC12